LYKDKLKDFRHTGKYCNYKDNYSKPRWQKAELLEEEKEDRIVLRGLEVRRYMPTYHA